MNLDPVIRVSHWWHQEGHLAKVASMSQINPTLRAIFKIPSSVVVFKKNL